MRAFGRWSRAVPHALLARGDESRRGRRRGRKARDSRATGGARMHLRPPRARLRTRTQGGAGVRWGRDENGGEARRYREGDRKAVRCGDRRAREESWTARPRRPPPGAIIDRGRLVGLWEYDVETSSIVWATFGVKKSNALESAVDATQA